MREIRLSGSEGGARCNPMLLPLSLPTSCRGTEFERFFKGTVAVLGVNLYSRGDDWNATKEPWKHAITAFNLLLTVGGEWERERGEMPVIKVN